VVAVFFLLWMPVDIYQLSVQRDEALQQDQEAREWITTLGKFAKTEPAVTGFVYRRMPAGFHEFGLGAGVKYFFPLLNVTVPPADSAEGAQLLRSGRVAILDWDAARHRLAIRTP
jgi:hypothetical protein